MVADRLFSVKAYAQDALSQSKRSKYQDLIEGQMAAKPVLEKIQQATGAKSLLLTLKSFPKLTRNSTYMQLNTSLLSRLQKRKLSTPSLKRTTMVTFARGSTTTLRYAVSQWQSMSS